MRTYFLNVVQIGTTSVEREKTSHTTAQAPRVGPVAWLLLLPIRFYRRFISPLKPAASCRFHPTCSAYALEAVQVHGALKGTYLSVRRILKCHPYHPGGIDKVPPR